MPKRADEALSATTSGSAMASVGQAVSGAPMPIRRCSAREVRPGFTPMTVSPAAFLRSSSTSCAR
ncbi:hypothetical protein [Nonomuraea sp. NPDC050202]|uniref:hypothetical protein n=1 Tax=Nonomuraea sp. NPDC050202 TaxID=3155035 RepID=UPI0033C0289C